MDLEKIIAMPRKIPLVIRDFFLALGLYFSISTFFLYGLITSIRRCCSTRLGNTFDSSAAINNLHSFLFSWIFSGFGSLSVGRLSLPYFPALNAVLAPFGFFGGTEIKLLALFLVAFAGVTAYLLARIFRP